MTGQAEGVLCAVMAAGPAESAVRAAPAGLAGLAAVTLGGLGAVLAPPGLLGPRAARRLSGRAGRAALAEAARRHALYEHLMGFGDVLPLAAPLPADRALAAGVLAADPARLSGWLAEIAGAEQYTVTVDWDAGAALWRFRDAPELAGLGIGAARRTGRALRGRAVAAAAEALKARLARAVEAELVRATEAQAALPIAGAEQVAAQQVMIRREARAGLEAALARIDGWWSEGLRLRLIGPLPPVSFAGLGVGLAGRRDIAAARRRLGVAPGADPEAAFRARARALHPDLGGGGSGDLDRLRAARDLLRAVAAARAGIERAGFRGWDRAVPILALDRPGGGRARSGLESAA